MKNLEVLKRIETLECKLSFQDHTIEQLNSALTNQQETIYELKVQIHYLIDLIKQDNSTQLASDQEESAPPHY